MTRKRYRLFLIAWLLCPVALLVYHYGPGQSHLARAESRQHTADARQAGDAGDWNRALEAYDAALAALPADDFEGRARVRILRANAMMFDGRLTEAAGDLQSLLDESRTALREGRDVDPELIDQSRAALASSRYYLGWVRRLEGVPRDEWLTETSQARQHSRLLAETRSDPADEEARDTPDRRNLEAAVRLERMDISQLRGLPLPEPVRAGRCRGQGTPGDGKGRRPGQGEGEKPGDDIRGAGKGHRPAGSGS